MRKATSCFDIFPLSVENELLLVQHEIHLSRGVLAYPKFIQWSFAPSNY